MTTNGGSRQRRIETLTREIETLRRENEDLKRHRDDPGSESLCRLVSALFNLVEAGWLLAPPNGRPIDRDVLWIISGKTVQILQAKMLPKDSN